MRYRTFIASLGFIFFLMGVSFFHQKIPQWKGVTIRLFKNIQENQNFSLHQWEDMAKEVEALPPLFPVTMVKDAVEEIRSVLASMEHLESLAQKSFQQEYIPVDRVWEVFTELRSMNRSFQQLEKQIGLVPDLLLSPEEEHKKQWILAQIKEVLGHLEDIKTLEKIFLKLASSESRIVFLLQNQNEPRPTGGFVGTLLSVDFSPDKITWRFEDIYSLSRRVPEGDKLPAPEFFYDLSQKISLHDANFWADFPTSAQQYIHFFEAIDEKAPDVVVALNLSVVRLLLDLAGPVFLENWGIRLEKHNFDLGLSFLVESKISGRFAVKKPVEDFMRALFRSPKLKSLSFDQLKAFSIEDLIKKKHILAYGKDSSLQALFRQWGMAGELKFHHRADNILFFDFVSVGANKSEKFMWTKFWHNSNIQKNGVVKNSLEIIRNHALRPGEIQQALGYDNMPLNTQKQLTEEVLWKLGAGQNRTVLRVAVPKKAKLISQESPSGAVNVSFVPGNQYKVFEVPMFVLPGERVKVHIEYETSLERGSHNWRPYFLELVGAYGKNQVSFLETISTDGDGTFTAKTVNIGVPQDLVDSEFRTVVEFGQRVENGE